MTLFSLSTLSFFVLVLAIFKRHMLLRAIHNFETRYRVFEDLYLVSGVLFPVIGHIYKCFVTKKVSLWNNVEKAMIQHPKKTAIVFMRPKKGKTAKDGDDMFDIESYTYGELYAMVLRLSHILSTEYGVKKGDFVSLHCTNKPIFVIFWLAFWNIGATVSFLNYNLKHAPLVHSLKVVNATQVFVDNDSSVSAFDETKEEIEEALPELKINYFDEHELTKRLLDPNVPQLRIPDSIRDEGVKYYDPAVLVYTSGTTGLPKSAVNSWRKVFFACYVFTHAMRITEKSNVYTAMPLYHGTASILGVMPVLSHGATLSIGTKFSLSTYWTQVKLSNANTIQYVGEVCRYLLSGPVTEDEKLCYGKLDLAYGNGLRADIWLKFKERFGIKAIGEFYASSEAPFATTCYETNGVGVGAIRNNGWLADKVLSNVYCPVKVEDEDEGTIERNSKGLCRKPIPGEKGELLMHVFNPKNIKTTFPGYLNNDEATYSKIVRDVFHKGDAWVRTDDLFRYDSMGCLQFVDRLGDTYRWKSENVSTTEVENEIMRNKSVGMCVVVGARVPNHEGRCGYIILQTTTNNSESDEEKQKILDEIATDVWNNLPHFARPIFVRFDQVEFTDNHKVSKKIFRDPVLPAGPKGTQTVYWLNSATRKYEKLNEKTWLGMEKREIRL